MPIKAPKKEQIVLRRSGTSKGCTCSFIQPKKAAGTGVVLDNLQREPFTAIILSWTFVG